VTLNVNDDDYLNLHFYVNIRRVAGVVWQDAGVLHSRIEV